MERMCVISNESELEKISTEIYQLIDNEVDIHVILQDHKCDSAVINSEISLNNRHPCHRVIFVARSMMHEMKCMERAIAEYYKGQPLKFHCPVCYGGLSGM